MALSAWQRDAMTRSAYGHLGAGGATLSDRDIVARIGARYDVGDPGDVLQIFTVVRAARRAWAAGNAAENAPNQSAPVGNHPADASVQFKGYEYGYRVLVEVYDPSTLSAWSTVVGVWSSTPLSPNDIRADALAAIQNDATQNGRYPDRMPHSASASVNITIQTAGRG